MSLSPDDSRLQAVADHPYFRKAPVLRDLLLYLWRHRDRDIGEYELATEVLERKSDFDPKLDSTVRVQIGRLRQRLKDYKSQPNADLSLDLEIPHGAYRLIAKLSETPKPPHRNIWPWVLAALCLALVADNLRLRNIHPTTPVLPAFWKSFLPVSKPVQIVVAAPVFFRWAKEGLVARDFSVNTPQKIDSSPRLKSLKSLFGEPDLSQIYTVGSDTIGANTIGRYLEAHGVAVKVFDTPSLSLGALENQDAILLAGPGTTDQAQAYLPDPAFTLEQGTGRLQNRKPRSGEPTEWRDITLAPERIKGYGTLSLLPGRAPSTRLLVVNSRYNIAIAQLLTTPTGLASLAFAPSYFDAVVEYERNGDRILNIRPLLIRHR